MMIGFMFLFSFALKSANFNPFSSPLNMVHHLKGMIQITDNTDKNIGHVLLVVN